MRSRVETDSRLLRRVPVYAGRAALALTVAVVVGGACRTQSSAGSIRTTASADTISCIGQPCGEPCEFCERGDPECLQAEVTRFCDANGVCSPPPVSCGPIPDASTTRVGAR